jgi:cellulose biosynthesis protein BcsQ
MTGATSGKIITFYSYKGGTGRSMAVANVGWLLAMLGKRVLLIDWDLEAPGLHRYLHPFLDDPELTDSPGLIDFFLDFSAAAREPARSGASNSDPNWWQRHANLLRYTYSLDSGVLDETLFDSGTLDFVPAGQQGPAYGLHVTSFNWQEFYDKLGGGVFLEGLKRELRASYDYVLIDSRTGISDTAGICTVQMPDDLVVFFTLNQQSIKGAAAIAQSADAQRRNRIGEPTLRIWPVPTRVELGETERVEAARDLARVTFHRFVGRFTRSERAVYWGAVEVPYKPFYAFEEVLAVFGDRPHYTAASILTAMTALIRYTTGESRVRDLPEDTRRRGLHLFMRKAAPAAPARRAAAQSIYISYPHEDQEPAARLARYLVGVLGDAVWFDKTNLLPGDDWQKRTGQARRKASVVLACFGKGWVPKKRAYFESEVLEAAEGQARVIPVLLGGLAVSEWRQLAALTPLAAIVSRQAIEISTEDFERDARKLADALLTMLASGDVAQALLVDPDDPNKGRFGGSPIASGRKLAALVEPLSEDWFAVTLEVSRFGGESLEGIVEFHLHPTFARSVERVEVKDGKASLRLHAWGAFTAGAVADDGMTRLELDLAEDPSLPRKFRER